jgi:catechol 2,3-dioxygenase-like lactoylglutathione lyase family enzyme
VKVSDSIRLSGIALNCPDAAELAAFYAEITGGRVIYTDPVWAIVDGAGGPLSFQTIPDHAPPTWPDPTVPNQTHLDFYVDDLAATEARVLAAGATKYAHQPNANHCLVFADPAGHPFCLSTWDQVPPG